MRSASHRRNSGASSGPRIQSNAGIGLHIEAQAAKAVRFTQLAQLIGRGGILGIHPGDADEVARIAAKGVDQVAVVPAVMADLHQHALFHPVGLHQARASASGVASRSGGAILACLMKG